LRDIHTEFYERSMYWFKSYWGGQRTSEHTDMIYHKPVFPYNTGRADL